MQSERDRRGADLIVVGTGVAGLSAALAAGDAGARVALLSAGAPLSGSSPRAQGGIAAALGPDDTTALHEADTLAVGAGLNDPRAVHLLVTAGKSAVQNLVAAGVPFDGALGRPDLGLEAGHRRRRIIHANGAATGHAVTTALLARAAAHPRITLHPHTPAEQLLADGARITGVRSGAATFRSRAVVLATGGYASLFARTTNAPESRGQGLALAWQAGATLADLEFVQFHPTALALPGRPAFLLSEALRGEGALLVNEAGEPIVDPLLPRDQVARAIARYRRDHGPVYLTLRHLDPRFVRDHFANLAAQLARWDVDLARDLLPVAPAAHYCMGGVRTDEAGRSDVPGLYVAGEAACTGAQGANRLASNSLLECLVFGRLAAQAALEDAPSVAAQWATEDLPDSRRGDPCGRPRDAESRRLCQGCGLQSDGRDDADCDRVKDGHRSLPDGRIEVPSARIAGADADLSLPVDLEHALDGCVGVERDATGLETLVDALGAEPRGELLVASLAARAALLRRESRGAHFRTDFPQTDPRWQGRILWRRGEPARYERIH